MGRQERRPDRRASRSPLSVVLAALVNGNVFVRLPRKRIGVERDHCACPAIRELRAQRRNCDLLHVEVLPLVDSDTLTTAYFRRFNLTLWKYG